MFAFIQSFHIAGDGKLGGLVDPNDGRCHLNSSGFYTRSREQGKTSFCWYKNNSSNSPPDYPSLGHIASVARENSVNIIWAVSSKHINLYTSLTDIIKASHAGTISSDSSNIVELIQVCGYLIIADDTFDTFR